MFEFVRTHTKLLQFMLVLLIFPSFIFFGVQGYQSFYEGGARSVAKVGGLEITQAEWDNAHRNHVDRVRAQMPGLDAKFFDSPEMKQQVLEGLVRERVLLYAAQTQNLMPSRGRLERAFLSDPQYAALRDMDAAKRKELLALQGLSAEGFEGMLRQDVATRQVIGPITSSALAPASAASAALDAMFQQREVRLAKFEPKDFAAGVTVSDAEIQAYYDDPAHAAQYTAPESASIEYLVLDLEAIKRTVSVSEDDLKKFYNENLARFKVAEERRARHILIKVDKKASAEERAKARAKAEAVLAQVQKNRAAFAEIAKKESQDEGSAATGGDLDYFGRGAMTKPFEDAVFAMKKGDLSGIVESEYGFHIIELTDARGGEQRSLESVRAEIEDEVKRRQAQARYAEAAEIFSNMVYEQSDSLAPAAEKLKLEVKRVPRLTRVPVPGAQGPLANPKFLEALFKPESLSSKRNTEAVDVGSNQLAAGRVLEYTPARKLPLAEVREQVKGAVSARKAAEAARAQGTAKLADWRKAPDAATLQPAVLVSRAQVQNLPRAVIDAVLREPSDTLPAWVGVDLGAQGYVVAKLTKVTGPDESLFKGDPQRGRSQYAQAWGAAEEQAYLAALRERFKVKITGHATAADSVDSGASAVK
jgi:peptidyl-prolyl cis-trans isomerase D